MISWLIRGTESHAFKDDARFSFCNGANRTLGTITAPDSAPRCERCVRLAKHLGHITDAERNTL
jgi:hypothetical protein